MKKKLSMILTVLMLILRLPVPAVAMSASEEVTIQTEIFSGFDITIPGSLAEKYRWSEGGYEGANWIHFYDRSQFDASGGKSSYEEADEEKGYLFSIRQYYYDGDYRYGMGDLMFYELFQPTRSEIVAFYSRDDLSRLMILSVEYADSAPVSVQKEALKIAGHMTPDSDVYLEDVDANPWNLKFANFLLNGRFRNMGQEYFDDTEMQACLFNVAGDDYPELIITNGAADGQSSRAYIYTFSENWQVEYLRTATTEELDAMPLQSFTAIRQGWGDFLKACGYQIKYLPAQISSTDWIGTYRYDDGDQGELYIIKESDTSEVRGVYVFRRADGGYDSLDFVWSKENSTTASEPFGNGGSDRIFHYLKGDRIVSDYPDGWWQDRDYVRVSDAEHSYFEEEETGIPVSYAGATVDFKESLFEKSSYEYDNELAKLGAMLNKAACNGEQEICSLLYQMKIEDANIENYNYGGEHAFSIAHRSMMLNGEEANLIFIVARGSQQLNEYIGDFAMKANRSFLNQSSYDYVTDFYEKIWNALRSYANGHEDLYDIETPRVFFITGYSLGGAAANLTAAMAKYPGSDLGNSWIFLNTDLTRIFAYTYGAIDSIDVDVPLQDGYEYIHNIFNYFDTFGPNGADILTTSGSSGVGKFGHIDLFGYQFSWENSILNAANHDISNYLTAIVKGRVGCCSPYSQTAIHCPIDVEVIKNGEVVGRITDNQVDESLLSANPEVALMVVKDSKHIAVFNNPEAYSLRITATDDGEMSVSTVSFDETGEGYGAAEYLNVAIENGQVFSMDLPATDSVGSDTQTPELLIIDGDRISGKVNPDGSISPVNGTGNGLQLVLLATIVIVSGLIVFLWRRKMKETKKLKFPLASIFTVILLFGLLANLQRLRVRSAWMDSKIGYRMVVEFGSTYSVPHILYQVLLIGSMILLAVLLFMRKRNSLLAGALSIQVLLPAFTLTSFLMNCSSRDFFDVYEYELHFGPMMWAIGICGCYVLEILCYLLLTLMTITPCAKDGERKRGLHRLWFLPGILSIFIAFAHLVGNIYFMRSDFYCLAILFLVPMTFLLGWWLTHPYKKEKPVYQMPIAQPYGQPVYQSVGTFDAAQKVICINCGRELLSDELFCAGCGTRRPEQLRAEPDHAEQKVFCSGCGRELPPDEDFCGACGTKRPVDKTSGHTVYGGHIDL